MRTDGSTARVAVHQGRCTVMPCLPGRSKVEEDPAFPASNTVSWYHMVTDEFKWLVDGFHIILGLWHTHTILLSRYAQGVWVDLPLFYPYPGVEAIGARLKQREQRRRKTGLTTCASTLPRTITRLRVRGWARLARWVEWWVLGIPSQLESIMSSPVYSAIHTLIYNRC